MRFIRAMLLLASVLTLSGCQFLLSPFTGTGGGDGTTTTGPAALSCDAKGSVAQIVQAGPSELGGSVYALNVSTHKDVTLSIPAYQDPSGTARIIVQACQQVGGKCDAEGPLGTTWRVCRNPQVATTITGPYMCNPSPTNNCQ